MKIIGMAGWSGAGKTTLIERVIPVLTARGLCVSTLKHAHHRFDIDQHGKDSWRHREAGAREVLVASAGRWALLHELREETEPGLPELVTKLSPVDLVILEGWRNGSHPKIEVWRKANGKPHLYLEDSAVKALVSDAGKPPADLPSGLQFIDLSDIEAIADAMLDASMPLSSLQEPAHGR